MYIENTKPQKIRANKLAKLYGVGLSTIWHYAKKGYLTPHKITDGLTLFDVKEAEDFFGGKIKNEKN